MREYGRCVTFEQASAVDVFAELGGMPVCVEVREHAEPLPDFEHPEDAVYVFGPEDGHVPKAVRHLCHRFVVVPVAHCLNLAAAVNVVLYDRRVKRQRLGLEPPTALAESRGWDEGR